jgi:F0F1-type ATP synthase assembly protein I
MGAWRAAGLATQFGATVVGCLTSGVSVGAWIDGRAGTSPAFVLLGIVAGLALSFTLIVLIYRLQVAPNPERS